MLLIISAETDNCPSFLLYTFDDMALLELTFGVMAL